MLYVKPVTWPCHRLGQLKLSQIIGGGTAGLTVANRLAKNSKLSVAVVEGGSFYEIDNGNYSQIPAYDVQFSSPDPASIQPLVDWGIVTSPQSVSIPLILLQILCNLPRIRVLMLLLLLTCNSNCKIVRYIIHKANAWEAGQLDLFSYSPKTR